MVFAVDLFGLQTDSRLADGQAPIAGHLQVGLAEFDLGQPVQFPPDPRPSVAAPPVADGPFRASEQFRRRLVGKPFRKQN